MKLYDFHITAEDVDRRYDERRWMGPEYRTILMAFRNASKSGRWRSDRTVCANKRYISARDSWPHAACRYALQRTTTPYTPGSKSARQ